MSKRHSDALFIWAGACNPSGIARSIAIACDEARAERTNVHTDPAIRLMVAQLAFLMGVWNGASRIPCGDTIDLTRACEAECKTTPEGNIT